jgi:hypothetical protein
LSKQDARFVLRGCVRGAMGTMALKVVELR